jgi:hypothetical protein
VSFTETLDTDIVTASTSTKLVTCFIFGVLVAMKMPMSVCRVVMQCGLVGRYQRFGEIYCFHLQCCGWMYGRVSGDGDSMFLRNCGIYVQVHVVITQKNNIDIQSDPKVTKPMG